MINPPARRSPSSARRAAIVGSWIAGVLSCTCATPKGPSVNTPETLQTPAQALLETAWPAERRRRLLSRTQRIALDTSVADLAPDQRRCILELAAAGEIVQRLYEDLLHHQAGLVRRALELPEAGDDLREIHAMFSSPFVSAGDGHMPLLAVDPPRRGKNVYPPDTDPETLSRFVATATDPLDPLLSPRSVVRRQDAPTLARDRQTIADHPDLARLHTAITHRLQTLHPDPAAFYALPYALAYPEHYLKLHDHLLRAAAAIESRNASFAEFLRLRARDLLLGNFDRSDPVWIAGKFGRIDAQIGSYETYADDLLGIKAFPSLSIYLRRNSPDGSMARELSNLQQLQDSLPHVSARRVRRNIAVGVFDVVADFGQSRGTNTASILPNEVHLTRVHGRRVLLRANVLRHPRVFARDDARWRAAVVTELASARSPEGSFQRTLWHEVGHYLGIDRTRDGEELEHVFKADTNTLEELKSDLVALYLVQGRREREPSSSDLVRPIYAEGIRRTLRVARPRRDQAYATMQLMQFNFFRARGLIRVTQSGRIDIDFARFHTVVSDMLRTVLELQWRGDPTAAEHFIASLSTWDDQLHGTLAASMARAVQRPYSSLRYPALERITRSPLSGDSRESSAFGFEWLPSQTGGVRLRPQ